MKDHHRHRSGSRQSSRGSSPGRGPSCGAATSRFCAAPVEKVRSRLLSVHHHTFFLSSLSPSHVECVLLVCISWFLLAMSLIQHVSSIEGVDREPPSDALILPVKAVRKVLSYDAFPRPHEDDLHPSVAAYKVSVPKRIGEFACLRLVVFFTDCVCSPGCDDYPGVLARIGHCLWVCGVETGAYIRRSL